MKKRAMILTAVLTAAVLAGGGYFPTDIGNRLTQTVSAAKKDSDKKDDTSESEGSVLDQATLMYQQYNYDEAIKLLKLQQNARLPNPHWWNIHWSRLHMFFFIR